MYRRHVGDDDLFQTEVAQREDFIGRELDRFDEGRGPDMRDVQGQRAPGWDPDQPKPAPVVRQRVA